MRKSLVALSLIIFSLSLSAQQIQKHLKASNGVQIGFYEYKPTDYSRTGGYKYPLIIFLHGIGERGNGTTQLAKVTNVGIAKLIKNGNKMKFTWRGKQESFIVLSPQLSSNYGNWQDFYVEEMIKYAKANLNIDPNRIFLTGLSLGGGGAWSYASSSLVNARKLAAVAPICGTCQMDNATNIAKAPLPVWAFHAKNDTRVSVNCTINAVKSIIGAGPGIKPKETLYADGNHYIWDRAYDPGHKWQSPNLYEWFLSQGGSTGTAPAAKNQKPVANAGSDMTITLPRSSATLNGSGSRDADGKISSYRWTKVSGPSSYRIASASAVSTAVTALKAGKYTFRLTVKDNDNATGTNDVVITVKAAATKNKAPVAATNTKITITAPSSAAALNGTRSKDPDGTIRSYLWTKIAGPSQYKIASPTAAKTVATNLVPGTYVFRLRVTDNDGASATHNLVILVKPSVAAKPPVAHAGSDIHLTSTRNLATLNGLKSTGNIVKYSWYRISGGPSYTTAGRSKGIWKIANLRAGRYIFRLVVTDDKNRTSTDDVAITVTSSASTSASSKTAALHANAGPDITLSSAHNLVTLNGTKSTGNVVRYAWYRVSGAPSYTTAGRSTGIWKIANLRAGRYIFRLIVTDDKNRTSADDVVITVNVLRASSANALSVATGSPELKSESKSSVAASLQPKAATSKLQIYPNPAISTINVSVRNEEAGQAVINIYDANARLVKKIPFQKSQSQIVQSINVSDLAKGVYNLELAVGNNPKQIEKFIKQ